MAGLRLALEGLELRRGNRTVLRIPSLLVAPSETLAILGPNGAGKSTLLSILAGLEGPTSGSARVGGRPATALDARRSVSLLPQDAPMLSGTVERNVEQPLRLRGIAPTDRRRRVVESLERMGLTHLSGRDASSLSGGETRRVAVARALVTDPEALLLDEPFNGIDEQAKERLVADLRSSVRARGTTLVLVTQRRDEAQRLAARLAVVWGGEIRQSGPIEETLSRPADPVVARFLGLENVLRGVVASHTADGVIVDVHGIRLSVAVEAGASVTSEVWVVFAPEHVELRLLDDVSRTSARNAIPATIVSLIPREGRIDVHLDTGFPLIATVTRGAADDLGLAPGARVRAVVKATALHVIPI